LFQYNAVILHPDICWELNKIFTITQSQSVTNKQTHVSNAAIESITEMH